MRESIKQFVKICAETLPLSEPVYEFGSLQVPGQEGFADLRPLFPDKKYIGADMRQGPGVDLILNLHDIALPSDSVGTVLLMDTLEHVEFPRKAIAEIYRILKMDGVLLMSSVMNFPIHDYPYDYWRFTPEAFRSLIQPFAASFVEFAGESVFPHTIVGIGFKKNEMRNMDEFFKEFKHWKELWRSPSGGNVHKWNELTKAFTPPIIFTRIQKLAYGKR